MKAAIISNRVTANFQANQSRILGLASAAVRKGAKLVLFPEAAATGLANTGFPNIDLEIAEPVPGSRNDEWRSFASDNGVFFAAGLLERAAGNIFDSALLFDPDGDLVLHHRRNDSDWHMPDDDNSVYQEGTEIPVVETPLGRVAFLICGDLWNDDVLGRLKTGEPDYLLYPFARDFVAADDTEESWSAELTHYRERWRQTGAVVLAANLLCDCPEHASTGGAWHTDRSGKVLASLPIHKEGVLLIDM